MDFIYDNGTSESFDDSFLSISCSEITGTSIFTFILYIFIILLIIILCYIIYKSYINRQEKMVNLAHLEAPPIRVPDLKNKTILGALQWCGKKYPDSPALMIRKENGNWSYITYEDYYKNCIKFAKELNYWVGSKAKVAILGFNSPAWFYSHLGSLLNLGVSIGIYPSSSPYICEYILNHAEVNVLVVENGKQLEKIIDKEIPTLKLILYYSPISNDLVNKFTIPVVSFGVFMDNKGKDKVKLIDKPKPDDIATIIYTSGTTGDPKGAVITHKNIIFTIDSILQTLQTKSNLKLSNGERFVSYLPLNHIAAQTMDIYIPICTLSVVWFADRDALKSTLVNTLKDARPTVFVGVPRVWEKMQEKIEDRVESNYISRNLPTIFTRNKIINELGLNKCKYCISTSSPISEKARDYFDSLGLNIYDIYGLSETGPITISAPGINYKGSVGIPIDNTRVKIDQNGELLVKSMSVFKGYFKDSKETRETLKDGWFATGDIGSIKNGYIFITGRKKEIIITSGGENIAPVPIEQAILKDLSCLDYVVVIGNGKKFLSALLVPKMKDGKLLNHFKKIDADVSLPKELNTSQKIMEYVKISIDRINKESNSNASRIQKWVFIENEFTCGQELTCTLKLRRFFIDKKYQDKIKSLYEGKELRSDPLG